MKWRQHAPNSDNETQKIHHQNTRLVQSNISLGITSCEDIYIIKNSLWSQILKQNPELEIWDVKR